MGQLLSSVESSRTQSLYVSTTSDRYHKLDDSVNDTHDASPQQTLHHSAHDLSSSERHGNGTEDRRGNRTSPELNPRHCHMTQEDRIASIRDDIGRFSKSTNSIIPTVSSRWTKFMNETEKDEEEERGERGEEGEGDGVHMHMLQSKLAVARYT